MLYKEKKIYYLYIMQLMEKTIHIPIRIIP